MYPPRWANNYYLALITGPLITTQIQMGGMKSPIQILLLLNCFYFRIVWLKKEKIKKFLTHLASNRWKKAALIFLIFCKKSQKSIFFTFFHKCLSFAWLISGQAKMTQNEI